MNIVTIIEELGLTFGEDGICRMQADGESVFLEPSIDKKHVYLHAVVGEPSPQYKRQLFTLALSGNLFGKETGYATLAFDPSIQSLVMMDRIPLEGLTSDSYRQRLAEFVHYLKHWKKILDEPIPLLSEEVSLNTHQSGLVAEQNLDLFFV